MKKIIAISVTVLIAGFAGWYFFLRKPHFEATNGFLVNVDKKGLIIEGYDPVAYFKNEKAVKGS
ncbi:MAG: hypothetical protein FJY20_11515 [Bacteroidetes bacterium]|nr:hypothetical protein [Bacteroidota bacterium]